MKRNDYKLSADSKYIPELYWKERLVPNTSENDFISNIHADFLIRNLSGKSNIFELGPGDGRLFKLYSGKSLTTLDLADNHVKTLEQKANRFNIAISQHYYPTPSSRFPFVDKQFDIAVASQVLIHVPFANIEHTVKELLRISNTLIIVSGKTSKWPTCESEVLPNSHCFLHDYNDILSRLNADIHECFENHKTIALASSGPQ